MRTDDARRTAGDLSERTAVGSVADEPCLYECAHLREWLTASCTSKQPSFMVTQYVLAKYCKTRNHRNCPFFPGNPADVDA
ncbi:MAG: hypothetical protein Kow0025_23590 [Thermodesulfovibrionales bacterium]